MRNTKLNTLLAGLSAALVLVAPTWAQDDTNTAAPANNWDVCNETSFLLRLATATMINGKMTPKGWTRLRSGQCLNIAAPAGTPRYVYAESSKIHQGGVREWKGEVELCASDSDFEADATISCPLQDLQSRQFMQVDPKESTTTFVEPDDYGKRAEIAGLQRLLRDNGLQVSRIDGYTGRRTTNPLNKFLKEKKLSRNISMAAKIDALADAAQETQSAIGFTVCNEATEKIWSAVAYRENGEWESRGWWPVTVGDCLRPFTKVLKGTEAHFFALREDNTAAPDEEKKPDLRLKSAAVKPSQFCIAEARFAAAGREYCSDRGYIAANFRPLPVDENGTTIILNDADFVEVDPSGLRR